MKHAAHKAAKVSDQRTRSSRSLFASGHGSHSAKVMVAMQTSSASAAVLGIDQAIADKLNEIAPQTRRSMRQAARSAQRKSHIIESASLAALVGTAASAVAFANPAQTVLRADDNPTTTTQLKRASSNGVSRSQERTPLGDTAQSDATQVTQAVQTTSEGTWQLGDTNSSVDTNGMSRSLADNPQVAALLDGDAAALPAGFDPNHATGDSGNAYSFSQCTWWVYIRRHELGLPAGSHMGNGNMWANSARALGYWVDNAPRHVGDIMVFAAGQDDADATYGHVAIVEKINADGSIETSECGSVMNGATYSKTYSASVAAQHEFIHY
jgi:surface antigen